MSRRRVMPIAAYLEREARANEASLRHVLIDDWRAAFASRVVVDISSNDPTPLAHPVLQEV